jgi:hypothetical protein
VSSFHSSKKENGRIGQNTPRPKATQRGIITLSIPKSKGFSPPQGLSLDKGSAKLYPNAAQAPKKSGARGSFWKGSLSQIALKAIFPIHAIVLYPKQRRGNA